MALAKRSLELLLVFGLLAALSCKYDPNPPDGQQKCADTDGGKRCPTGYECRGGKCYNTPADAGEATLHALPAAGEGGGTGGGWVGHTIAPPTESDASAAAAGDAVP